MCGLMLTVSSYAQQAKSVLDKASSEYKKCPSITAEFELAIGREMDKGTILLQGQKFYTRLSNTTTWFDGKTMWSYVKDNEEVNVTEPKASQLAKINPYAFLDMYKSGYSVVFGASTKDYYDIVLTANDSKHSIQKAILHISKTNYQPMYIMMGSSRAEIEINITSFKKGKKQADSVFKFDAKKYPKVEIVDLR